MYRDIPTQLREVVEPILASHGLELVDTEILRGPGGALVRVVVDTPAGDGLVPVGLCADVSREIATSLDADAQFARGYRLEVASPGLDRVLAREKDFAAARGSEIKIETRRPIDGRRRFRGPLLAFDGGVARVAVDGREHLVPFDEIARARQVYQFTPADFSKSPRAARRAGETS
jgi:ribosome maturation factor RimP